MGAQLRCVPLQPVQGAWQLDLPALLEEWASRVEDMGTVEYEGEGLRVLGLSVVANVNDPDHFRPIRIDEIIAAARKAEPRLQQLIINLMAELPS